MAVSHYPDWQFRTAVLDSADGQTPIQVLGANPVRRIEHADALDHVFGYTVANDVTARDYMADGHWTRPKGYDTFCPVGPWIETQLDTDEVILRGILDGVEVQRGTTAGMVMDVASLITYATDIFALEPGDLILTGSPPGRATLAPGQTVHVSADCVGEMSNPVQLY
ncbi:MULTISPECIES: fumarylacetoacetate hydrolase family protein [Arthrobacter]|uniref:Fumarylacetoacetate hydrolase family protein n=1 Tax=Arthrobacter terricola TaxID=2547396 RepID=A0A4R5K513_9MICC|nr:MULTISPECIES: fumarylacetoacetate hydrolase family protein [Arthrobacter]MBT8159646.1 fumarylacetoacetate hydrolase family protein [Arthrobacter sp. GN70]TDF87521.1 fumarylacetoacetate hydrolase family protein [Arthrobacter terricola]